MSDLSAGWARFTLHPPAHYPMTGYLAREHVSEGTLDPLCVRALVLGQGRTRAVLLVIDLLLVSPAWSLRVRKLVARELRISVEHVILAATHTHSGPLVDTSPFQLSQGAADRRTQSFMRVLEKQCVQAAVEASERMRSVTISHARCPIRGLATDRTRCSRDTVQWFDLIRFDAASSSALFGVLPCHPTVLGASNDRYSGDLHGEVARRYEKEVDVALIANGATANISTRFTRTTQTRAQVSRFASMVLRQAHSKRFKPCAPCDISLVSRRLEFPVRNLREAPLLPAHRSGRLADVMLEGTRVVQQLAEEKAFQRKTVTTAVTLLRLGPIALAALPMELYAETGRFLWSHSRTIALCYANGYWGYVYAPGARPFDYEVLSSPFDKRADALVRETVLHLQRERRK